MDLNFILTCLFPCGEGQKDTLLAEAKPTSGWIIGDLFLSKQNSAGWLVVVVRLGAWLVGDGLPPGITRPQQL